MSGGGGHDERVDVYSCGMWLRVTLFMITRHKNTIDGMLWTRNNCLPYRKVNAVKPWAESS